MSLVAALVVFAAVLLLPSTRWEARWARAASGGSAPAVQDPRVVDIADAADLIALTLAGGGGVCEAIESVSRRLDGAVGEHLRHVADAQRLGMSEQQAWAGVPQAWAAVATALRLASAAGIPPTATLTQAAADLRRAEDHRIEVETARLGVRIVLPLGLTFLPAFVLSTIVPVVLALGAQVLRP